ncbi:prepilin-type N-terminal cleavage/methylation domain-containing protein [Massilia norwichensis]|uniref:Prepilin-type N-terminal cleavage/methylation domain-containing protein n=1 Tax=Massilia norwichensis TaxID=1442366 RepID=A0ABT2A9S7_9BURK|nr:prepilin-type N-terminal cleavage/methylation domain-containing protein [Massilia norwichensis]MCS0590960.1 prepilin-type N-terminal cleavage/methylation domain-containing protein [Massilia norwichensis]
MKPARLFRTRAQQGFALVESLVAVALLAIGLIGMLGLQARSVAALEDSAMRTEATLAAESLLGIMATDQANLAAYAVAAGAAPSAQLRPWHQATIARIPSATIGVTVTPGAAAAGTRVDIRIAWTRKAGTSANQHRITSYIAGSKT